MKNSTLHALEIPSGFEVVETKNSLWEEVLSRHDWKVHRNSKDFYYWFYVTGSTEGIKENKTKSLINALNWLGLQGFENPVDRGHNCMILTKTLSNG